jgi:hypothetical protein
MKETFTESSHGNATELDQLASNLINRLSQFKNLNLVEIKKQIISRLNDLIEDGSLILSDKTSVKRAKQILFNDFAHGAGKGKQHMSSLSVKSESEAETFRSKGRTKVRRNETKLHFRQNRITMAQEMLAADRERREIHRQRELERRKSGEES